MVKKINKRKMEKLVEICRNYACERHAFVNQKYDGKPYSFHLEMGVSFFHKYSYLLTEYEKPFAEGGLWCHDIIDDARETYNDTKRVCGEIVANIAFALSNEKGKTPEERENQKYYDGILECGRLAIYDKICDRLANGTYSKSQGSGMYKKYKLRYPKFRKALNKNDDFKPMWDELDELFEYSEPESHTCLYSKSMNQPHPRLCVICGLPEPESKSVDGNKTTDTLILGREDMIDTEKGKNILLIDILDFKISVKPFQTHGVVLFIDDNGHTKILKNRFGDDGTGML